MTPRKAVLVLLLAILSSARAVQAQSPRVFVTSVSGSGKLELWDDAGEATGVAAGDAICQARAGEGELNNPQNFRAWLSSTVGDAFCHVHGLTGIRSQDCNGQLSPTSLRGPWLRLDGQPFGAESRQLVDHGKVYTPPLFDEYGDALPHTLGEYWTGGAPTSNCAGWTTDELSSGRIGCATQVGFGWLDCNSALCSETKRLLCVEAVEGPPIALPSESGSLAFVTSARGSGNLSAWPEGVGAFGVGAGDKICRARALAARLPSPSSFVAWLSVPGVNAPDRIASDGPFVRVDGLKFADSMLELLGNDATALTGLNVTESASYVFDSPNYTWTGSDFDGTPYPFHCTAWTDAASMNYGGTGSTALTNFGWMHGGPVPGCNASCAIYCFSDQFLLHWDNFERGDLTRWSAQEVDP